MKYLFSLFYFLAGVVAGLIVQHNLQIYKKRTEAKSNSGYWKIPDSPLPIMGKTGALFKKTSLKIDSDFPLVEVVYGSSGTLYASENEAYDLFPYRREVQKDKVIYKKGSTKPVVENCRFVYIFNNEGADNALCMKSRSFGGIYRWAQGADSQWRIQNDSKPLLTQSPNGIWQQVWNVSVAKYKKWWIFIAETGDLVSFGLNYTWTTDLNDTKQLQKNKSTNYLLPRGGSPWIRPILNQSKILLHHGLSPGNANESESSWDISASTVTPCFTQACVWKITSQHDKFNVAIRELPISVADPEIVEIPGTTPLIRLSLSNAQDRIYEYEAPISFEKFGEFFR